MKPGTLHRWITRRPWLAAVLGAHVALSFFSCALTLAQPGSPLAAFMHIPLAVMAVRALLVVGAAVGCMTITTLINDYDHLRVRFKMRTGEDA